MRKIRSIWPVLFVVSLFVMSACSEKENQAPVCEVISPEDGTTIMQGESVTFLAKADDEDGSVTSMTLYIEGEEMAQADAAAVEYEWDTSEEELGEYAISGVAKDDEDTYHADHITVVVDVPGGLNPDLTYGTLSDIDGNSYGSIEIGDQVWMAENLRVTHYADGSAIPQVSDDSEWAALLSTSKAYSWYDNAIEYGDTCGTLYTWAAAMNGAAGNDLLPSGVQGVCPDGWHIPSDGEWKALEMFLGMSQEEADNHEWRGSDEGGQLKETGFSHWEMPNTGALNSSGFTAVPGGFRSTKGTFHSLGDYALYWTSSEDSETNNAWYRTLNYIKEVVYRNSNYKNQGFSVRCVAD